MVEAGAQYAHDNVDILDLKRRREANKSKRRVNMGGPLTSLDANRHIKVRDGVERKKLIQQAKKKWIASATAEATAAARTSKSGDLNSA